MALLDLGLEEQANPCKKFIKFHHGKFQYWDKVKKEEIALKLPLEFCILSELQTVTGFHDPSQSAIYSNEVYRGRQEVDVRSFKGGPIAKGFWTDIKNEVSVAGGKFCHSIYALLEGELVNFHFAGSLCGAWIERPKGEKIRVEKLEDRTKGVNKFKVPIFELAFP